MLRRSTTIVAVSLAVAAFPAGALATAPAGAGTAHGLLRAAANFDAKAVTLTAKADALQVTSGEDRVKAGAATPVDQSLLDEATRLDAQAARLDAKAATFVAKAAAFRAKAAARLTTVDDTATAAPAAHRAEGLTKAAGKLRAKAAARTLAAATLRTEANATTPADADKLERAAELDANAAKLLAAATKLEAKAAALAAVAEQRHSEADEAEHETEHGTEHHHGAAHA